jgi:hypothetical protein
MVPEFSLRDRPFIVCWGRRDAPAGAPTVMLSPVPYEYDLPYGSTGASASGYGKTRRWTSGSPCCSSYSPMLFPMWTLIAEKRARSVPPRPRVPAADLAVLVLVQAQSKRSGKSMHEMLLDDIEAVG